RCNRPDELANGSIMQRRSFLRFRCFNNYFLLGRSMITCGGDGRLTGERPFCARPGCIQPQHPENGEIELQRGLTAVVVCRENFVVAGNVMAHCNGNNWDRQLGVCRHRNHTQSHACDFETEDQCGWTSQLGLIQPWRRVATVGSFKAYRTGPRHDHTLQNAYGGHYMLMETNSFAYGAHHLISPIYPRELSLKTACCFRFHYFMYGAGVGSLVVSVKPAQMRVDEMWEYKSIYQKFNVSGNLGNQWLEHTLRIDEMPQDFQVVFTATDASSHLGDIAIDDVRLMTGKECGVESATTTTEEPVKDTEPIVFDFHSCQNRCNQSSSVIDELQQLLLIKGCGCTEQCLSDSDCCPDYLIYCLLPYEESTTQATTTTTTKATPTNTTTTTTAKPTPTTRRATTTTTTKKPTTTRKTTRATKPTTMRTPPTTTPTTTTTTRKPTTTSTTTTRRAPVPPRTTSTTTAKPTTTATTTTTTTTTTKTTKATTPNTTKFKAVSPTPVTTRHPATHHGHYNWPVSSKDLEGNSESSASPARFMWYSLLAIMLVIVLASVLYRWRRPNGGTTEKAVSFQKTLAKLRNATLPGGKRLGGSEASAALCENTDDDENDNDVQFEEMGVDIRNVTQL
ncbi:hypothetical protein KR093_004321, partial [Drosophila rubida]